MFALEKAVLRAVHITFVENKLMLKHCNVK